MKTTDILLLYDYNCWASARILSATLQVTPEEFAAGNTSSYGSLRGTLVHILSSEMIWRRRLQGEQMPTGLPREADFATPQLLHDACMAEETRMRAYLSSLGDSDLEQICQYKSTKGMPFQNTIWHLLSHMLNHGTQHRAEAAAMLTDWGHSPGDVDMILYLREKGL
jgi:uncharacterized damage-inducible protein DinB